MSIFAQSKRQDSGEFHGVKHPVPARNVDRILLEVEVMSANGTVVAGQHLPDGKSQLVIYADQLAELEGRTQTPAHKEAWARAEAIHARAEERAWVEHVGRKKPKQHEMEAERERLRDRTKESVAEVFCREFYTGRPPVAAFKILERGGPPVTAESSHNALVNAAIGRADHGEEGRLRSENAELRATLASHEARFAALEKRGKQA